MATDFDRPRKASGAHGGGVRGDTAATRSTLFEGRFGRMFRALPAATWEREVLMKLGSKMTADPETDGKPPKPSASAEVPDKRIQDDEENAGIAAGYTYLGQFIDHDITFDPASSLQQQNDPDALVDFRTPRLDLDSLYGRGPADQPYLYDDKKLRLGRPLFFGFDRGDTGIRDLPRFNDPVLPTLAKRALIGDKRNDENVIVSQLHAAMLQFHNKLVDRNPQFSFEDIQQLVRWHYQWIVVNDFLVKICGKDVVHEILPHLSAREPIAKHPPRLAFYHVRDTAFMPIEFAAAAYRFGHSMVRPIYRLNAKLDGGDDPREATKDERARGIDGRFFIFAGVQQRGLNGFDEFPEQWAIDWSLFFDINDSIKRTGKTRVQPAYKIDTSLVNPLRFLPEFSNAASGDRALTVANLVSTPKDPENDPAVLAQRNLLRGKSMGLPSGQDVARAMGIDPIDDDDLKVGKATFGEWDKNPSIVKVDASFEDNAPLWYYVLAEAQWEWHQRAAARGGLKDEEPLHLGRVGGRIVAETLIGLLWADGHSYLRQAPNWQPDLIHDMGGLLKFALG